MSIAYLNGHWSKPQDAKISVFDRGFMFGDGVYEVMPVYHGHIFTLDQHIARLKRSMAEVRIQSPLDASAWKVLLEEAVSRSGEQNALIYLQVTRGIASERSHVYPEVSPTILVTVTSSEFDEQAIKPISVICKTDFRWSRGDIKVVSLIANGMLKNQAMDEGFDDAILIRDGMVTEGTSSNVFAVKDRVLWTPPKSEYLLHGITRDQTIELARDHGLEVREENIRENFLKQADEIWLTASGLEILPVGKVNGQTVGNGSIGETWCLIKKAFQEEILKAIKKID